MKTPAELPIGKPMVTIAIASVIWVSGTSFSTTEMPAIRTGEIANPEKKSAIPKVKSECVSSGPIESNVSEISAIKNRGAG